MKDYVEVNEKKCSEAHNCMCTKEIDGKTYCRGCGNVQPEQEDQKSTYDEKRNYYNQRIISGNAKIQRAKIRKPIKQNDSRFLGRFQEGFVWNQKLAECLHNNGKKECLK